ncbi:MAG: carbon-nitrogen hydrolase family protein [Flavobacteriaceae bacterium]
MAIGGRPFTAAAVQMRSGVDPLANFTEAARLIREAAKAGASYIQTPEMTNILQRGRAALFEAIHPEKSDPSLKAFRGLAAELGVHLHIGSLALKSGDGRAVNRAFVIAPDGTTLARYDKIHMFDVDLAGGESYRESATYDAGDRAVVADLPEARLGIAICYDLRFPHLFRALARGGADILAIPAAFTRQTGRAHWHVLMRARAIENGCFVVAAAQGGRHEDGRETYGHSLIVSPWGEILAEADGDEPGFITAAIDPQAVAKARAAIPALANDREFRLHDSARLAGAAE